jgi:5-enolpyruvylshikimate-3-phosphate synthase
MTSLFTGEALREEPLCIAHGDHRLGMAFASLGLALGSTVVENADCVEKTYPRFWTAVRQLGGLASIVQAP